MINQVVTKDAPDAIGPYSQAMISGNMVFTSGQIPISPGTGVMVDGGIAEQTEQVMRNIGAVLAAAGAGFDTVVKTTCYLSDMANFQTFNEVYAKYFASSPARSCIAAKALPKDAMVEVEAIALISR